jgi:hypothetical protein
VAADFPIATRSRTACGGVKTAGSTSFEQLLATPMSIGRHLELAAATVAAIYKERWQIELFFRALKPSLRVKTFVGTSANALKTQLWTALIAMLVVKYLQTAIDVRLVPFQSGGPPAAAIVCLP